MDTHVQEVKETTQGADVKLLFIWALQKYAQHVKASTLWKEYGPTVKSILEDYKNNSNQNVTIQENGLITAGNQYLPLTWMDTRAEGKPITPRPGYAVEVNALWYNAVSFALETASAAKDNKFVSEWQDLPNKIKKSFVEVFWDKEKN